MKIVVLRGGSSNEREISLISGKHVANALKNLGHDVFELDINDEFIEPLKSFKPSIVFNALHGKFGEDGCIQGMLNILNLPYTHSGVRASSIAMHKPTAKICFQTLKIKTPKWKLIYKNDLLFNKKPFGKYVIKPMDEGSSIGVQIINNNTIDFKKLDKYEKLLVEKYIPGKELSVATLNGVSLGVAEIISQQNFHDYDSKYVDVKTEYILPANIKKRFYDKAMLLSENLFKFLDCRGIIRMDFRLSDETDDLFALEVNTHPGLTPMSLAPKIAKFAGITYEKLIEDLIQHATIDP